jgi:hypothetical protein
MDDGVDSNQARHSTKAMLSIRHSISACAGLRQTRDTWTLVLNGVTLLTDEPLRQISVVEYYELSDRGGYALVIRRHYHSPVVHMDANNGSATLERMVNVMREWSLRQEVALSAGPPSPAAIAPWELVAAVRASPRLTESSHTWRLVHTECVLLDDEPLRNVAAIEHYRLPYGGSMVVLRFTDDRVPVVHYDDRRNSTHWLLLDEWRLRQQVALVEPVECVDHQRAGDRRQPGVATTD